ncbi:hypothetical protein NXC14_CH00016 [Rhizobium sp. NXC14]|nr:hypothetical protein NXC14_CH00016 [Rhizobium sp. NXC14]
MKPSIFNPSVDGTEIDWFFRFGARSRPILVETVRSPKCDDAALAKTAKQEI